MPCQQNVTTYQMTAESDHCSRYMTHKKHGIQKYGPKSAPKNPKFSDRTGFQTNKVRREAAELKECLNIYFPCISDCSFVYSLCYFICYMVGIM